MGKREGCQYKHTELCHVVNQWVNRHLCEVQGITVFIMDKNMSVIIKEPFSTNYKYSCELNKITIKTFDYTFVETQCFAMTSD